MPLAARLVQSTPRHWQGAKEVELDHPGEAGFVLKGCAKARRSVAASPAQDAN